MAHAVVFSNSQPPIAAQAVLKARIEDVEQLEVDRREIQECAVEIQECAVNDALCRVEVLDENGHILSRLRLLRPRQIALKFRCEMRIGIGDHAQESSQVR
jgi:hypothetical protein